MFVHETAIVEDNVLGGDDTRVWHHCHVRSGATLGNGTQLGKNVYVDSNVSIGEDCKIQNNVSVYQGVTIGDRVFVGPSAVFTNDLFPRADNDEWEVTTTEVGNGSSIGANATIKCGVSIGEHAMIGAGAVVTRDVAPHQLMVGNPARPVGWVCACGKVLTRESRAPDSYPPCTHRR